MTTINIILATLIILTFLIAIQLCKETFILGSPMRGHEYYPDQTPLQQSIEKRYEQLIAGRYPDYKTRGFPDYPGLQSDLANLRRQAEQETSETRQQQRTRTPYTSRPRSPQKQQQRTRSPQRQENTNIYVHRRDNYSKWEFYTHEVNKRIDDAIRDGKPEIQVADGSVFVIRFGENAISQRVTIPPSTGMLQVNISNQNSRVVGNWDLISKTTTRPLPIPPPRPQTSTREIPRMQIVKGGVTDFGIGQSWEKNKVAIVNAANVGGIGGGGIDGVISRLGGKALDTDRQGLIPIRGQRPDPKWGRVRIMLGDAKTTGPNIYGSLYGNYVIHAVGPDYNLFPLANYNEADRLLSSAYISAMREAEENGIEYLGFCLISAGIFRGKRRLEDVIKIGLDAINNSMYPQLKRVYIYGFTKAEHDALQNAI